MRDWFHSCIFGKQWETIARHWIQFRDLLDNAQNVFLIVHIFRGKQNLLGLKDKSS